MGVSVNFRSQKYDVPITFAVKHKALDVRMASRSGGIFTALSDSVLAIGGVVYGCILDETFTAIHYRAIIAEDRNRMRGSKYIQSEMRDIFASVKGDLEAGRAVLFSGTSCQVAGLICYLGKDYHRLFCIDIVCHGVPSPRVWHDYIAWQERKHHSKVIAVDFRNKCSYGWKEHIESLFLENGRRVDSKIYTTLFYSHFILRPCCFQCPYKDIFHPGNITIADYWGIEKVVPGFSDNRGVSLVLINDKKGLDLFSTVMESIDCVETKIEDSMQMAFEGVFTEPENRDGVWEAIVNKKFSVIAKRYGGDGLKAHLRLIKWKLGLSSVDSSKLHFLKSFLCKSGGTQRQR